MSILTHPAEPGRSRQVDLEVRALIIVDDPGGTSPAGETSGPGAWDDVAEPRAGIGLQPAVLHSHRAFLPVIGTPGDPLGGHVRPGALLGPGGHELRGGVPGDPGREGFGE